jgi:hypothetical protein
LVVLRRNVFLKKFSLQFNVEWGLIVPERWDKPILWIQEYFSVCCPDSPDAQVR